MKDKITIHFSLNKIEYIVDDLLERRRVLDYIRESKEKFISLPKLWSTIINRELIEKVTWETIDE